MEDVREHKPFSKADRQTGKLTSYETAEEKMKRDHISLLLFDTELILVHARNHPAVDGDDEVNSLLGGALKNVQKIQKIGGYEALDF